MNHRRDSSGDPRRSSRSRIPAAFPRIIDPRGAATWRTMHRCGLLNLFWIALVAMTGSAQLIKPVYVYERLIRDIHIYFNNTCIILLHNNPNPTETQGEIDGLIGGEGRFCEIVWKATSDLSTERSFCRFADLREGDRLLLLQKYLSSTLHIRTTFMDFNMFKTRVNAYNLFSPFFPTLCSYYSV